MAKHISCLNQKDLVFSEMQTKVIVGQQKEVEKEVNEFMSSPETKYCAVFETRISLDSSLFICYVITYARYNRANQNGETPRIGGREGYQQERNFNNSRSYNDNQFDRAGYGGRTNGNYRSRRYDNHE